MQGFGHGLADGIFGFETDGHDGGSGSTQESSNCSRLFGAFDGVLETRNQGCPVGLVKTIRKGTMGFLVFFLQKSGGDARRVAEIEHGILKGHARGKKGAGGTGRGFDPWDGRNEFQFGGDLRPGRFLSPADDKATQRGGGDVVRMALQGGGGLDEPWKVQGSFVELVEGGQHSQANGGATPEASGWRNQAADN